MEEDAGPLAYSAHCAVMTTSPPCITGRETVPPPGALFVKWAFVPRGMGWGGRDRDKDLAHVY
ncbi:hypothetical protein Cadr_000021715 [Camelus dromedarius]|uniref:Uncharacterized protein n=1 Tax=Camelus dromedarius TaxID=9838 RepID=A0A5N4CSQ7_CAMDR|nr:hypothetical protein Cadr_000021715 [Camelus dromedarius]